MYVCPIGLSLGLVVPWHIAGILFVGVTVSHKMLESPWGWDGTDIDDGLPNLRLILWGEQSNPQWKKVFVFFSLSSGFLFVEANLFPTKKSNIEKTNGHSVGTLLPRPNFRHPNCLLKFWGKASGT